MAIGHSKQINRTELKTRADFLTTLTKKQFLVWIGHVWLIPGRVNKGNIGASTVVCCIYVSLIFTVSILETKSIPLQHSLHLRFIWENQVLFLLWSINHHNMTLLAACDQTATSRLCNIWIFKAQVSSFQQCNEWFKEIMDFKSDYRCLIVDHLLDAIIHFIMGVKPVAVAMWKKETF